MKTFFSLKPSATTSVRSALVELVILCAVIAETSCVSDAVASAGCAFIAKNSIKLEPTLQESLAQVLPGGEMKNLTANSQMKMKTN
jgi:hypothetical protein